MPHPPPRITDVPSYAVNLDKRPDRWEYLTRHMKELRLPAPTRWSAIDGVATTTPAELQGYQRESKASFKTVAACYGNNRTFSALLQHVIDQSHPWALLMEDDAYFHPEIHTRYARFAATVPDDALLVMLGAVHRHRPRPVDPDRLCWRVARATCATAYLITPEGAQHMLDTNTPRRTSIDRVWYPLQAEGRAYAPNPHLAVQRPNYSDIGHKHAVRSYRQYGPEATATDNTWSAPGAGEEPR